LFIQISQRIIKAFRQRKNLSKYVPSISKCDFVIALTSNVVNDDSENDFSPDDDDGENEDSPM